MLAGALAVLWPRRQPPLAADLAQAIRFRRDMFTVQDLAIIATAFVKMHLAEPILVDVLNERLQSQAASCSNKDLCLLLWAGAMLLRWARQPFVHSAAEELLSRDLTKFSTQDLCTSAQSLAKLDFGWKMVPLAEEAASRDLANFDSKDKACLFWALTKAGAILRLKKPLRHGLLRALAIDCSLPRDLALSVIWSFGHCWDQLDECETTEATPLLEQLLMAQPWNGAQPFELANVTLAAGMLQTTELKMMSSALAREIGFHDPKSFTLRGLCYVMFGLTRCLRSEDDAGRSVLVKTAAAAQEQMRGDNLSESDRQLLRRVIDMELFPLELKEFLEAEDARRDPADKAITRVPAVGAEPSLEGEEPRPLPVDSASTGPVACAEAVLDEQATCTLPVDSADASVPVASAQPILEWEERPTFPEDMASTRVPVAGAYGSSRPILSGEEPRILPKDRVKSSLVVRLQPSLEGDDLRKLPPAEPRPAPMNPVAQEFSRGRWSHGQSRAGSQGFCMMTTLPPTGMFMVPAGWAMQPQKAPGGSVPATRGDVDSSQSWSGGTGRGLLNRKVEKSKVGDGRALVVDQRTSSEVCKAAAPRAEPADDQQGFPRGRGDEALATHEEGSFGHGHGGEALGTGHGPAGAHGAQRDGRGEAHGCEDCGGHSHRHSHGHGAGMPAALEGARVSSAPRVNSSCDFPGHCIQVKNTFIHMPCEPDVDGEQNCPVCLALAQRSQSCGPGSRSATGAESAGGSPRHRRTDCALEVQLSQESLLPLAPPVP